MVAMGRSPWGDDPLVEWDEVNEAHVSRHGVAPWEVEEMINQGEFGCVRHPRSLFRGRTLGGRPLLVVVDRVEPERLRPLTAWADR
jgi:hypothetical protein